MRRTQHDGSGTGATSGGVGANLAARPRLPWRVGRGRALVAALGASALLVGCTADDDGGGSPDDVADAPETGDGEAADVADAPNADTVGLPPVERASIDDVATDVDLDALDGLPVLSGLVWTMWAIGPDGPPTQEDAEAALSAEFLAEVSSEQFVGLASQLQADWRVTALDEVASEELQVQIAADGELLHLWLVVSGEDPPRITGMLFQPPLDDPLEFENWDDAEASLTGQADVVAYLAARVEDGACVPIAQHAAEQRGPLGSAFKLYVLGAVVDAVAAGEIGWDDDLEITEDLLSHPSGVLQAEEPGTRVSVANAAELMIAVSDNTATDLLIDAVGREAVEAAMGAYGHRAPERNQPLLTTREMFQLAASPDRTTRFVEADTAGRRGLLEELAGEPLPPIEDIAFDPHVPHEPEWYASPAELCDALVALDDATSAGTMEPGRAAFAAEPPLRIDDRWRSIGGKGGSQPGVQAHTWLLERDGQGYAFTITLDHSRELDLRTLIPALEGAIALMAAEHDG